MTREVVSRLLDWDSEFFGRRIARVVPRTLDEETVERIRAFARSESIECLYLLLDAEDTGSIGIALDAGFVSTDVRVTRERSLRGVSTEMPSGIEGFREEDLPSLREIARSSHGASRFYHDPHFPRERCDSLYDTWISNACAGAAEHVLVARRGECAVGYLTCEIDSSTTGTIGLVAVREGERGKRLGESLVREALAWFADHDRDRVRVVSQQRNDASARLYERLGFRTTAVERWYHLWPNAEEAA